MILSSCNSLFTIDGQVHPMLSPVYLVLLCGTPLISQLFFQILLGPQGLLPGPLDLLVSLHHSLCRHTESQLKFTN